LCLFAASVGPTDTNIRLPVFNPHVRSKRFTRDDRSKWGVRQLVCALANVSY